MRTKLLILTNVFLVASVVGFWQGSARTVAPLRYKALVSQDGIANPTAVVLTNDLGVVSWQRIDAGTFKAFGPFIRGRTIYRVPITEEGINNSVITVNNIADGEIYLTTTTGACTSSGGVDGILGQITGQGTPIEFEVYPEP